MDEVINDDQKRRDAITRWWEQMALRDFIARKRAERKSLDRIKDQSHDD